MQINVNGMLNKWTSGVHIHIQRRSNDLHHIMWAMKKAKKKQKYIGTQVLVWCTQKILNLNLFRFIKRFMQKFVIMLQKFIFSWCIPTIYSIVNSNFYCSRGTQSFFLVLYLSPSTQINRTPGRRNACTQIKTQLSKLLLLFWNIVAF